MWTILRYSSNHHVNNKSVSSTYTNIRKLACKYDPKHDVGGALKWRLTLQHLNLEASPINHEPTLISVEQNLTQSVVTEL